MTNNIIFQGEVEGESIRSFVESEVLPYVGYMTYDDMVERCDVSVDMPITLNDGIYWITISDHGDPCRSGRGWAELAEDYAAYRQSCSA